MDRWPKLDPGDLRHRITIESATVTRNADLSEEKAWSDWASDVPAKLVTSGGREFSAAKAVTAELTHLWQIRWRAGLTTQMRVKYSDPHEGTTRYMDIRAAVNPTGIPVYLDLHCVETVNREPQS